MRLTRNKRLAMSVGAGLLTIMAGLMLTGTPGLAGIALIAATSAGIGWLSYGLITREVRNYRRRKYMRKFE